MKKRIKRVMALVLSGVILVCGGSVPAKAASTASGPLGSASVHASISTDSSSATAITTCSRGGSLTAKATVYYWFDTEYYKTSASAYSAGGGVSAIARKQLGGAEVIGGKGEHIVKFESYTWDPVTTIGTIRDDALNFN